MLVEGAGVQLNENQTREDRHSREHAFVDVDDLSSQLGIERCHGRIKNLARI